MSTTLRPCPDCGIPAAPDLTHCASCGASLTGVTEVAASEPLPPGTLIGSYRLLEVLGEGGMGRVYAAEHIRLGRRVALKMLRPEYAANPIAVARFFAEARAVNRISHENIVEITDFCEKPGSDNYYIMELLKGEDLTTQILRAIVLPLQRSVDIAAQVASAFAAVHEAGIVHRDLKPDNVFLVDRRGRPDFVKVLDFGVAKLIDPGHGIPMGTTAVGAIVGTPEYMSPEQAGGQPVDHRSDIYALGVVLYELVTGQLPFEAKSFGEMVIKHMTVPPKRPSAHAGLPHAIPEALEALILQMLAKDAGARPPSMTEVEERLRDIHDELTPIPPVADWEASGRVRGIRVTGRVAPVEPPRSPTIDRVLGDLATDAGADPDLPRPRRASSAPPVDTHSTAVMRRVRPAGRTASLAVAGLVLAGAVGVAGWFWLHDDQNSGTAVASAPPPVPVVKPSPPPEPTEIQLHFVSTPSGATVRVAGRSEPLGQTPFDTSFPRGAAAVTFEFELPGFTTASQEVGLDASATIAAALTAMPVTTRRPERRRKPPPRPAATTPVDRGGTMPVFED